MKGNVKRKKKKKKVSLRKGNDKKWVKVRFNKPVRVCVVCGLVNILFMNISFKFQAHNNHFRLFSGVGDVM